jgi:hypothetical protein
LSRYIATIETSKHRFFVFLDNTILPDNMLVNIALDDAFHLGVLSSRVHISWALASGGTLEDRPRYNKSRCFETFPFPDTNEAQKAHIHDLAKQLDTHRKRQQELYDGLTLTSMYNVLEKLRREEGLTNNEKTIHEQGLVSVLGQLHDELDTAVLDAYGLSDLAPTLVGKPGGTTPFPDKPVEQVEVEDELLSRLVALNTERSAEERRGNIGWLRPDYQNPDNVMAQQDDIVGTTIVTTIATNGKQVWPKALPDQVRAVRSALDDSNEPMTAEQIARQFKRARTGRVQELVDTLVSLGQCRLLEDGRCIAA